MSNDTSYDPNTDPNAPYVDYGVNPEFTQDIEHFRLEATYDKLNFYLSIISISCGFLVLFIMTIMWLYDRKLVDRVSLRLTAMISFVDMLNGGTVLAYTLWIPVDGTLCTAIGFGMSFFPQLYLFLTVMIAFNLQVVFLHRRKVSRFSDRWYVPVAFLTALIINIPPLVYNRFGFDIDVIDCLYREGYSEATRWWSILTFFIPITISMIYCTTVLMIVVCKLIFEHRQLAEVIQSSKSNKTLSVKARHKKLLLLKLVSRISLYALIPLLNVSGILVELIYTSVHKKNRTEPQAIIFWSIIGTCSPGIFNFFAFVFDPALHNGFRRYKRVLVDSYGFVKPFDDDNSKATVSLNSPPLSPSEFSNPNSIPDTKPIFIDGLTNEKITFGEFKSYTRKVASGIVTLANSGYKAHELTHQLSDSRASVIIAHPLLLPTVLEAAKNVKIPTSRIFVFDEKEDLENGIKPFTSLYKDDDDSAIIHYTTEEKVKSTTAYLCYSSGTTGRQKGVETTHYNMIANLEQVYHFEKFTPDLVFLGILPLFHIYALNITLHQVAYSGASAILLSKFDINSFCQTIQDYKINLGYIVPPILLQLVKNPVVDKYDLSSLKFIVSGAAPLSKELSKMFNDKFKKIPLKQGYGLTETTPVLTLGKTDDVVIGSSGIIIANVEIKFIDENGKELGVNEEGEICARGPNIMKGYLNNEKATKECMDKDGFFHTGDLGNVFLVDRVKELIKYKGHQVAPAELESVLLSNPIISDAGVVGIYSEQDATELPVAYVELVNPAASDHQQIKKSIQDYVAEKVAHHMRLRGGVYIIDKIPKSASGKILRKDLRERLKSEWVRPDNL
ncbi:23139_t:CDS:10 [Entrophospora sp. SA101]|nr:23139_t:CDS:10 [Entrophospora sp. SA101]CAJ0907398.1 6367_t:CDS:10 [Entrophospora sp. SA101]